MLTAVRAFPRLITCRCGWVFIARNAEVSGYRSHLSAQKELEFYSVNGDGEGLQYLRALFWALVTMSGVGYGDITPVSLGEVVFAAFAVAFGTSFFLFTVGSVTSLISSVDAVNAQVLEPLLHAPLMRTASSTNPSNARRRSLTRASLGFKPGVLLHHR